MRFLLVDRIINLEPRKCITGIKHVTPDDYYLMLDPITLKRCFLPALMGETVGQLAAWNVMAACDFQYRPVAGIAEEAIVHKPVYVGETVFMESNIVALDDEAVQYEGKAFVGQTCVFELKGALGPMLPMEAFIDSSWVRAQYQELIQPSGHWVPQTNQNNAQQDNTVYVDPKVLSLISFDGILNHKPHVSIEAQKCITRAAPYFSDHFPKRPVLPMTILLECVINLARHFTDIDFGGGYQVDAMRRIKMNDFVIPGDVITAKISLARQHENQLIFRVRVARGDKRVCILELCMSKSAQSSRQPTPQSTFEVQDAES